MYASDADKITQSAGQLLEQVGRNLSRWKRVLQLIESMAAERSALWLASVRNHNGHRRPESAHRRRSRVASSRMVRRSRYRQRCRYSRDRTTRMTVTPKRRLLSIHAISGESTRGCINELHSHVVSEDACSRFSSDLETFRIVISPDS